MGRQLDVSVGSEFDAYPGLSINFDDYGILMYYAYTVNQIGAEQLYKATTSEYYYRLVTGMSLNSLDELDYEVFISLNELQGVIDFINNDVIPSLQLLPQDMDLVESWNIEEERLGTFLAQQGNVFDFFSIDDIDTEGFTPPYLVTLFIEYALIFSTALAQNSVYYVRLNA